MTLWISVLAALGTGLLSVVYLQYGSVKAAEGIPQKIKAVLPGSRKKLVYCLLMVLAVTGAAVAMALIYKSATVFHLLKRICLLSILWPAAYTDYLSHKISNKLLLVGFGYRVIILVFELVFARQGLLGVLISEGIACVALCILALLCTLLIKNSFGMGDVKLFMLMGLMQGTAGVASSVFLSLIVSFFAAVFLLVTRKKGRKDVIPFAPMVLLGTLVSVIITGA